MASTVRISSGGGKGGGGPPHDEPPGGETPSQHPPEGASGAAPDGERTGPAGPSTQRTPLVSGASAAPPAPVIAPASAPGATLPGAPAPEATVPAGAAAPAAPLSAGAAATIPASPAPASPGVRSDTLRLDTPAPGATPVAGGVSLDGPALPPGAPAGRPRCPECGERFSRGSRFCAFDGSRLVETAEDVTSDPLVGQTLGGKYVVLRPIGEGGMGTVYEVRHTALDRKFALKILRPEIAQNGEHIQRFLQEAKAAAAIGHPNIVSVSDFGEHELRGRTVPFIVMELLRGTSLAELLKEQRVLPARHAAQIIADCAEALSAAHEAGVIHRDLKPDNIFLSGEDGEEVKVLDFGVAKMQGAQQKRLTKMGMVFGTPHYMSPEQARGQAIDHRADIYALGIILYECLCGRVPFEADTSMGVLTKQIFANPDPIERVAPESSGLGALGGIVMRCLAKEPDDRFASMAELAASIRMVVSDAGGAAATPGGAARRSRRPALRLREQVLPPRHVPAPAPLPAPARPWTHLVLYALAVVSVLALIAVSVRTFLLPPGPGAAPGAPVASSVPPPSAQAADTAPPAVPVPTVAALATSNPASASPPSSTSAPAASSPASARPSSSQSASPTRPVSSDVLDPWSRPTKRPGPGSTGAVVDPWAPKKK